MESERMSLGRDCIFLERVYFAKRSWEHMSVFPLIPSPRTAGMICVSAPEGNPVGCYQHNCEAINDYM